MQEQHHMGIGAQVVRLRKQHGWSQRQLAREVGLDQSALSRIEAGRRRVSAAELQRFTEVFRVSADDLLGGPPDVAATRRHWSLERAQSTTPGSPAGASSSERELLAAIRREKSRSDVDGPQSEPPLSQASAPAAGARPPGNNASRARPASAAPSFFQTPDPSPAAAPSRGTAPLSAKEPAPQRADTHAFADDELEPDRPDQASVVASRPAPGRRSLFMRRPAQEELPSNALSAQGLASAYGEPAAETAAPSASSPGELTWSAQLAGVVRDWFRLRALAVEDAPGPERLWSTGQTAEGKPASSSRAWQPLPPPPGSADVLYDRVARFWRSELRVDPDDGPLPDLVPLVEDGLGIQIIVARIGGLDALLSARHPELSDPRPVAATVVSDGVPFVFVNAGRPVVLQRFALVHAFAHLVLGHGDVVDESIGWSRADGREAAANDFAEEFLAPARAVDRWYARRPDLPRTPSLDTLLELGNAFGISAWAALFRSRAAGRLHPKQFTALRSEMKGQEWELLPRQAFLGGLKDTLAHLTPAEVLPVATFGPPAVLRVPARMRAWSLSALRDGRLSLEDAAALLHVAPSALERHLAQMGFE